MKRKILLFAGTILMTFSIAGFDVLAESLEDDYAEEACIIEEESSDDGNESYASEDISLQTELEEDSTEVELQIESVTVEDDPGLTVVDMDEEGISAISDDTDSIWETVMPSTITTVNGVYYYEISSAEELAYIAETGGEWLGYNYILKNDIILNNVTLETDSDGNLLTDTSTLKEWIPISDFSGIFDGNGYSISGVYEDRDGKAGFFLTCTGDIYNLSIKNSYIKGTNTVGGICATFTGIGRYLSNCSFSGVVVGENNVGGLIGQNHCSYINDCTNYGEIFGTGDYVAGIVGNYYAYGIVNCVNTGNVKSLGDYVAGIAGYSQTYSIEKSSNSGIINGNNYVAGICGYISNAYLYGCSNSGDIIGGLYVGGISGYSVYSTVTSWESTIAMSYNRGNIIGTSYVGGITGYLNYSSVTNCYSVGAISGTTYIGALIGDSESVWGHGEVLDCYYLKDSDEAYFGFGNITEDIENVVEGRDATFFPILLSEDADASYSALGYSIENYSIVLSQTSYTYDGTAKTPQVTVKNKSGELAENIDYEVSYSNNWFVGTASVTVTGIGDYNGSIEKTFTINKASNSITATIGDSSIMVGRITQIKASGIGVLTYTSSDTTIATVNSAGLVTGVKAGIVTIVVKAAGNDNYNESSTTVTVTIKANRSLETSVTSKNVIAGNTIQIKAISDGTVTYTSTNTDIATVSSTGLVTGLKPGNVTIKVTAVGNEIYNSVIKTVAISVKLADGKISSLTNTSKGITVKWSKVTGATGYTVYRKTSSAKKYTKVKTVTSGSTVSYTDTTVKSKNGTTYLYKVVPYYGSTVSSGTAKTTVRLTGVTLSSVKNSSSKKAAVKWKKTSKVSGYQIQYSTSKTFASGNRTTKVSGVSKTSKTLTGLKKGKTYYVRVRTYKTVNGKTYYSAWSSKKSVQIKK